MVAVSMAIAGAILMIAEIPTMASNGLIYFARSVMLQISNFRSVSNFRSAMCGQCVLPGYS